MNLSAPNEYLIDCPVCGNYDDLRSACRRCDGKGQIVSDYERRGYEPRSLDAVWTHDERIYNLAMNRGQRLKDAEATIVRLEAENRAQRRILVEQARLLDHADLRPSLSASTPMDPRAADCGGLTPREN
jgi:hypothetical protein